MIITSILQSFLEDSSQTVTGKGPWHSALHCHWGPVNAGPALPSSHAHLPASRLPLQGLLLSASRAQNTWWMWLLTLLSKYQVIDSHST